MLWVLAASVGLGLAVANVPMRFAYFGALALGAVVAAFAVRVTVIGLAGVLLPIHALPGLAPVVIEVAALGLLGLALLRQNFPAIRRPRPMPWLTLLTVALIAVTALHADRRSLALGMGFVAACFLGRQIGQDRKQFTNLGAGYIVGAALSCAVALLAEAGIADFVVREHFRGNAGLSGSRSLLAFEAALALAFLPWSPKLTRWRWPLGAVLLGGMLVSGGRGGPVALAVAAVALAVFGHDRRLRRRTLFAVVVVVVIGLATGPATVQRLVGSDPRQRSSLDAYASGRLLIYDTALVQSQRAPLGQGLGTGVLLPNEEEEASGAHNVLLVALLAGGYPLAAVVLAVGLVGSWLAVRLARHRDGIPRMVAAGLMVFLAWGLISSGPLGSGRRLLMFVALLALAPQLVKRARRVRLLLYTTTPAARRSAMSVPNTSASSSVVVASAS